MATEVQQLAAIKSPPFFNQSKVDYVRAEIKVSEFEAATLLWGADWDVIKACDTYKFSPI